MPSNLKTLQNLKKTFDLSDCSQTFFKKRIEDQLYGYKSLENYGSIWEIDHCLPLSLFNLSDENELQKCFNWIKLRQMFCNEKNLKKSKIDH